MKKYSVLLAIIALVFASLACNTLTGGGNKSAPTLIPPGDSGGILTEAPTMPSVATSEGGITVGGKTDYPMPDDAANVVNMGNDLVSFQTKLSLDEAMKFYRDQFGKLGYTEREADTLTTDALFIMSFDGDKSGKTLTIQGADMGNGATSITIVLSDN